MKKIILITLSVLLLSSCFFFSGKETAPAFTLSDLQGNNVDEKHFMGKVTLVNFWYPSCPGCVVEMPKLIDLQNKMQDKPYQTFAISLNYNNLSEVNTYSQTRNLPFVVMYDADNAVSERYGVELTPSTLLVDQQGNIVRRYVGEPDWQDLQQRIDRLLH